MKRIKVSEATEIQLDWLVAKIENHEWWDTFDMVSDPLFALEMDDESTYSPTEDWAQGGPIIEREFITIEARGVHPYWFARMPYENEDDGSEQWSEESGPTPLIAAMRCYVASKLGNEVEVPDELCTSPS